MSEQKYCIQCGRSMETEALFCPQCGARQDDAPSQVQPAQFIQPMQSPHPTPPQDTQYQQPAYQPPYQQPYPPHDPPKKRGSGLFALLLILFLLAGGFYGLARFTQLLPESVQEALPDWLQSNTFDADEGEYIVDDEGKDDVEDVDAEEEDIDEESASNESSSPSEKPTEATTSNEEGETENSNQNNAMNLTNEDLFGKWEGELTFTEIALSEEDKADMTEEDIAMMEDMLNSPMPLVFHFYQDEAGLYTTIGVISSPDLGDSDMDTMNYSVTDGKLSMGYADDYSNVVFDATIGESNGTYALDGTFSIDATGGGGQTIKGLWNASQTSTEVPIP